MADLEYDVDQSVGTIRLNRPDRKNAFTAAMIDEWARLLVAARTATDVNVIVVTGAPGAFCSGVDLSGFEGEHTPLDQKTALTDRIHRVALALEDLDKPVIAAVNGVAAGAGANIALACDLVIAARSATFVQAFSKIGLLPDSGGTWTLPRLVGNARALGLTLLGNKLPAEQAAAWGMIWQCVEDAELAGAVDALARQLAEAPTRGLAWTKAAIRGGWQRSLAEQLDVERDAQRELGKSADYAEGVAAFIEKRTPRFTGR